jgi:hypothetical protein
MRFLGNVLFYLLLISATGYLLKDSFIQLLTTAKTPYIIPNDIDTDISRAYLLDEGNSLSFKLSQAPKKLWLGSTARFYSQNQPELVAEYQLQVDFLDSNGQVIYSHQHNTHTEGEKDLFIDQLTIPQRFFETVDFKAAKSRSIYFSKDKYLDALTVRVSLNQLTDNIKDVAISFYQRQRRDSKLSPYVTWQRMSEVDKKNRAKWHALPVDFIDESEQSAYAEYRWDPVAPDGIPGVNIEQINLYKISKQEGFWPTLLWNNQIENLADNYKAATFAVHDSEEVTFKLNHAYKEDKGYQVTVKWYPPYADLPEIKRYDFSSASSEIKQSFDRGLVEITSTIPVDVSAIKYRESAFPNEKHFISTYVISDSQSLEFEIDNIHKELIPVRLDIRQHNLLHQPSYEKPFAVGYQWLDKQGNVIKKGNITTNITVDIYQQLVSNESYDQVSMASSKYFVLPANVHRIRLTSPKAVLASLFLSFDNINHSKSLPAQVRSWFDFPDNVKYWHELKPQNWQQLEQQGHRLPIRIYHKPVFIAPEILAGDFQSNSVPTLDDNIVWRDLMTPYISHGKIIRANPHFTYSRIKANTKVIRLVDKDKENSTPNLFFIRKSKEAQEINLTINNEVIKPSIVTGKWGRINLLKKAESYQININGEDIHWYLNQQEVKNDSYLARRGALIEDSSPIVFKVNKATDNNTLLLRFFSIDKRYAELSISIKSQTIPGVYKELTRKEQVYKLTSDDDNLGFVMHSNQRIGQEHRIIINLLSDLPKGEYELEVRLNTKSKGFIALNEITTEPVSSLTTYKGVEADYD